MHNHKKCIKNAIKAAHTLCEKNGLRFTPLRQQVLEIIWRDHNAIKAYDILHIMSSKDHTVKPPIVYRTLDFFLEHGLIHKLDGLNAYIGCSHPENIHTSIFFICEACGHVDEVERTHFQEDIADQAKRIGFLPARTHIETHGICKKCC